MRERVACACYGASEGVVALRYVEVARGDSVEGGGEEAAMLMRVVFDGRR